MLGAGGQVGRALIATAPMEVELVALDRAALDLTDTLAVESAIARSGANAVINAAAYTAVDAAERDCAACFALNRDAVAALARATDRMGSKLVHLSTDFVFDGMSSTPYVPDAAIAPLSVYGRSKAQGETAALAAQGALVVRTSWVYASAGRNFVLTMLRQMRERAQLSIVDDQVGTPTHAVGLARTLWLLIDKQSSGVFHVTDAGVASWYDFAVAIAEEASAIGLLERAPTIIPIATSDYPTAARRPTMSVLDKRGTWSLLGAPASHWRHELRAMLMNLKGMRDR